MPLNASPARTRFVRRWLVLMFFMACVQPASADITRIAVVGPFTGDKALATSELHRGAQAAAEELSALDGRLDLGPYELSLKNDLCNAAVAVVVAKQIVAEGYDLVLGHPCPKAALAAAKVYGAAGVTFIATETRHPALTAKRAGPSVFRSSGRDDAQGLDAARYLSAAHGGKPVAIVHDRTLYAKTIAEEAAAALKEMKIETITATIVAGDKEYGKLIAKIKDAGAVFFAGFPLEAGFILKELRAAGSTAPFLATESVGTQEFVASFADLAQHASILRRDDLQNDVLVRNRAHTATRLYAWASAIATGPNKNTDGRRALVNATIANLRGSGQAWNQRAWRSRIITGIAFDKSGNLNVRSFGIVRWNGTAWQPIDELR